VIQKKLSSTPFENQKMWQAETVRLKSKV